MCVLPSNPARESTFFSVYSLVSVEVRPVSKNYSCSWSARAPDCPSLLVRLCLFADQYSPAHFYMGFFFFGGGVVGRDRVLHFTPFSTLYIALSQHMRLLRIAECEWESGCERMKICCFIFFCWHIFHQPPPRPPQTPPQKEQLRFCTIGGYLTGALSRS